MFNRSGKIYPRYQLVSTLLSNIRIPGFRQNTLDDSDVVDGPTIVIVIANELTNVYISSVIIIIVHLSACSPSAMTILI